MKPVRSVEHPNGLGVTSLALIFLRATKETWKLQSGTPSISPSLCQEMRGQSSVTGVHHRACGDSGKAGAHPTMPRSGLHRAQLELRQVWSSEKSQVMR